jgi:hypothetical protein
MKNFHDFKRPGRHRAIKKPDKTLVYRANKYGTILALYYSGKKL